MKKNILYTTVLFISIILLFSVSLKLINTKNNTASVWSSVLNTFGYSSDKSIISFGFKVPVVINGEINDKNKAILTAVPIDISRIGLTPIIKVSPGATISPASKEVVNWYKQPIVYTVTAEDGTTQKYNAYIYGTTTLQKLSNKISDCQGLQDIDLYPSGNFYLVNDIDCTGINFKPLAENTPFTGTFDGNGYTIKNLTINNSAYNYDFVGLFGRLSGTVEDIKIDNANINGWFTWTGGATVGGIAGYQVEGSSITDSSFNGTIVTKWNAGGLVGESNG